MNGESVDMVLIWEQRVLKAAKVGACARSADGPAASLVVDPWDDAGRYLRVRLESYVLRDHLTGDTFVVSGEVPKYPSTWQFFKQRHASAWWLRWLVDRRPVRMSTQYWKREVTFDRYALYPNAPITDSAHLGRPVIHESYRVEAL